MKKAVLKETKKKNNKIEDQNQYKISDLLKIVLLIVIVLIAFYFLTTLIVKKNNQEDKSSISVIDSELITFSNLLNRNQDSYYVLALKSAENNGYTTIDYSKIYNQYINEYKEQENALEFYKIDLSDALNKKYISETMNISNDLEELKVNDDILFKIQNSSIIEYYVGSSNIISELSKIKES